VGETVPVAPDAMAASPLESVSEAATLGAATWVSAAELALSWSVSGVDPGARGALPMWRGDESALLVPNSWSNRLYKDLKWKKTSFFQRLCLAQKFCVCNYTY
jgi:hypothetical protein